MPKKQREDSSLGGYYARDTHRGGFGDNYARDDEKTTPGVTAGDKRKKPPQRRIGKASE
jgi:hypothetical protein